jgi:hypothetical protein
MLLAIDPGEHTGWAVFNQIDKSIIECGLGDCRLGEWHRKWWNAEAPCQHLNRVIIEQPVIYPRMKARPNDIITLAVRAGEWGGVFHKHASIEYIEPFKWKGSVPKEKHQPRIWAKLTEAEHGIVERAVAGVADSYGNNIVDAVGLGLWQLKRLPR